MFDFVTSPLPPALIARMGPLRPEVLTTKSPLTIAVGQTTSVVPLTRHNSWPSLGSYAMTQPGRPPSVPVPLTTSSLRGLPDSSVASTSTGVLHEPLLSPVGSPCHFACSLVERFQL